MNKPLVSVLMPCFNAEKYVETALGSILNQTYKNLEVIAINDCSSDNTVEILKRIAKKDARVKVFENNENLKLIKTLNRGVTLCSGDYIARMDADDIALPVRIEKEVAFLEQHPNHDIVSSLFYAFNSENPKKKKLHHSPLYHDELCAYLLFKSGICHPAVMMRKRIFTELGLSFEAEYLHVEDYALWSKAVYLTRMANLDEGLLLYRVHNQQVSSLNEKLQLSNKKKVFKIHCQHLGLPQTDEFLDIYASVAESVPSESSLEYLGKCEDFMHNLLKINLSSPFCNGIFLRQMLSIHWIRLCANSRLGIKVLKKLKASDFYNKENYSFRDIFVLYVKCIFKLKYKESFIYNFLYD